MSLESDFSVLHEVFFLIYEKNHQTQLPFYLDACEVMARFNLKGDNLKCCGSI